MKGSPSDRSSPRKTSDSAVALAAVRLQERLVRQIEQGIFCAVDPLGELIIYAREVRQTAPLPEHRVLAFVLECVLGRLQYDQEDRPVHLSESTAFQRLFLNPVTAAANCLSGKGGEAVAIADALVLAASEALPT
jgi:hypothetical protein